MAGRILWWFHFAGRNTFKRVSFYIPYNRALSTGLVPDLGDVGHQHFVKFNMKGGLHLFLQAQFTHVIKTHISQHSVPW